MVLTARVLADGPPLIRGPVLWKELALGKGVEWDLAYCWTGRDMRGNHSARGPSLLPTPAGLSRSFEFTTRPDVW